MAEPGLKTYWIRWKYYGSSRRMTKSHKARQFGKRWQLACGNKTPAGRVLVTTATPDEPCKKCLQSEFA